MSSYKITSGAGIELGTYVGATKKDALDAMARDAGYRDHADACDVTSDDGADLVVKEMSDENYDDDDFDDGEGEGDDHTCDVDYADDCGP